MQCIRHAVVKDSQDKLSLYREPTEVQIDVDLRDADPTVVLPKIKNDLFFASVGDAVDEIPKYRKNSVPANIDKSPAAGKVKTSSSDPPCDCAVKDEAECGSGPFQRLGMIPPKFLKGKDPEFTDEARRGFMDAHVEVGLKVDKLGRPYDVWVLRPVGKGLDEAAAKSGLTYVFRPATCHDSPVDVYLNVDVRFQRY